VIATVVGRLLLLTLLLIFLGLLVFIITVMDEDSIASTMPRALKFLRERPIAMKILSLAWLISRAFLSLELIPIPHQFTIISLITDTTVEFAVLVLYLSSKRGLTEGSKQVL
jgi:hypothetical protein